MIKNFFVITLRSFFRNWNFTVINVLGLSVGIASCIVIFLVVNHELKFDKFHSRYRNTYRVVQTVQDAGETSHTAVTPYPFINAFHNDFPDIPLATQFHVHDKVQITYGDEKTEEGGLYFADSLFFRVFDFKVIEGDPNKELGQPGKIFLTESLAKKLLKPGKGRTLKLNTNTEIEVAGIVQDPPASSHIQFSMIASMPSLTKEFIGLPLDNWQMNMAGYSYVILPEGMKPADLQKRFADFVKKYNKSEPNQSRAFDLFPLAEIHFDQKYQSNDDELNGISESSLVVMSLLGIFILVVACINFVNLSTALAVKKSREIGVRKTLGATRKQLSRQFLSEAFLITGVSLTIALRNVCSRYKYHGALPRPKFLQNAAAPEAKNDPLLHFYSALFQHFRVIGLVFRQDVVNIETPGLRQRILAKLPQHFLVAEQADGIARHIGHVADLAEKTGDALNIDLGQAAAVRGHDGHFAGHGFECGEAQEAVAGAEAEFRR